VIRRRPSTTVDDSVLAARELHVSESAVSKHISSIFAKLQLPEDPTVDRRVRAVLSCVTGATPE
jgi:hypothetical protein